MNDASGPADGLKSPAGRRQHLFALAGFALLTLLMFGDLLFSGGTLVPGKPHSDLWSQFIGWRTFGFGELAKGNLALWNPHIFSGAPYFGGFQAALLYPPNVIYLILPIAPAINWDMAMHVFLMGTFTYAWIRFQGVRLGAAFLAGVLMMFGGTFFMHIYAGHLTNLCTMVWAPLIFLAIDWIFAVADESTARLPVKPMLLGMFAVAMQIFAGHPQYVMFTAIAAGCYSLLRLLFARRFALLLPALAAIYVGGALLAAVQLGAGVQANAETIRNLPVPYDFATMFGFPPENILTLIAPDFFGNKVPGDTYWGRCFLWEMSVFFGVVGSVCAVYGAFVCEKRTRWVLLGSILLMAVLALGARTPLFHLLYYHAPGFDKFRGMSKFTFPASLFFVALAARGFDQLMDMSRARKRLAWCVFGLAGLLLTGALGAHHTDWHPVVVALAKTNETYLAPANWDDPAFLAAAQKNVVLSLVIAAATAGLLGLLLCLRRRTALASRLILLLAVTEMFVFARHMRDTFDATTAAAPAVRAFLDKHPGDFRILDTLIPNSAMVLGAQGAWGIDPDVVRRYAEFMAFTQGLKPDDVTQNIDFTQVPARFSLLRMRHVFDLENSAMKVIDVPDPLDHVQLVPRYRLIPKRDDIFAAMWSEDFDPHGEVVLESRPQPEPADSGKGGTVRLVNSSTDWLEIEADTPQPAILLITDIYTPAWRAVPLAGSSQSHYDVLPADYILRAVPLAAGHHHLRVEYAPKAYFFGKWISLASWFAFIAATYAFFRTKAV